MFVGGLITNNHWINNNLEKAIAVDVTLAIGAFVTGILMMTHHLPGASFGALPSSLGFTLMTTSLVAGVIYFVRNHASYLGSKHHSTSQSTLKDRNKTYQARFTKIIDESTEVTETKKLLSEVEVKLGEKNLTPNQRKELEALQLSLRTELGKED